jgi:DNA helicase-2/ATP-dependent DNA helicase PcrA
LNYEISSSENEESIKKIKSEITKYFNSFKLSAILSDFVTNVAKMQLKKKEVPYECRYAFLVIYKFLYNKLPVKSDYRLVIIDEAQDYPKEVFSLICKLFHKSIFNIAGDIMQSINSQQDMTSWTEYEKILLAETRKPVKMHYLRIAYRTTNQIAQLAKNIADRYVDEKSNYCPVKIRDGSEPVFFRHGSIEEEVNHIINILAQSINVRSVAIIDKDYGHLMELEKAIPGAKLLKSDSNQALEGVMLMDPYCAKGLEFDCVIIPNSNHFKNIDFLNDKLLYISITRALHYLFIGENYLV